VSEANPPETPRVSRRKAIGIGGAAAAAAWAAPSILAIDKVGAAGTGTVAFGGVISAPGVPGAAGLNLLVPAGTFAVGTRLVAIVLNRWTTNKDAVISAAGWTTVPGVESPAQTPSPGLRGWLFTRTQDVATDVTYTFTKSGGSGNGTEWVAMIVGFTGVDVTDPFNPASASSNAGESGTAQANQITTTVPNVVVLYVGGSWGDGDTTTFGGFAGTTPIAEGPNAADSPDILTASRLFAASGPTGDATTTILNADANDWVAFQLGIRPA
jgi:hypothetical protein